MMDLLIHIEKFVSEVEQINTFFEDKYKTSDVMKLVREGHIAKEGRIMDGKYYFHGIGCRVIFPDRTINFDYSPKKVIGGFGLYDIIDYLESKDLLVVKNEIEEMLSELLFRNKIKYPELSPNKSLFYLVNNKYLKKIAEQNEN